MLNYSNKKYFLGSIGYPILTHGNTNACVNFKLCLLLRLQKKKIVHKNIYMAIFLLNVDVKLSYTDSRFHYILIFFCQLA
jgi:hypothetical protein